MKGGCDNLTGSYLIHLQFDYQNNTDQCIESFVGCNKRHTTPRDTGATLDFLIQILVRGRNQTAN